MAATGSAPRNGLVAELLQQAGLAGRVIQVLDVLSDSRALMRDSGTPGDSRAPSEGETSLAALPLGLYGASSGAALALIAAAAALARDWFLRTLLSGPPRSRMSRPPERAGP